MVRIRYQSLHQKIDKWKLVDFFIHCESNGISSPKVYLISRKAVYAFAMLIYNRLAVDDIQFLLEIDDMHAFWAWWFCLIFTWLEWIEVGRFVIRTIFYALKICMPFVVIKIETSFVGKCCPHAQILNSYWKILHIVLI